MRRAEPVESEIEAGDRRFLGKALPPHVLAQPPADFEIARQGRAVELLTRFRPQKPSRAPSALRSTIHKVWP